MLTRIEIDGFKSFRDFSLDLPPFLVVLGRNASGKSNLFDAIRFLSRCATGTLIDAVHETRGELPELFHRFSDGRRMNTMRFAVEVLLPDKVGDDFNELFDVAHTRLRYGLEVEVRARGTHQDGRLYVAYESAERISADEDRWSRSQLSQSSRARLIKYQDLREPLVTTAGHDRPVFTVFFDHEPATEIDATEAQRTVLSVTGSPAALPLLYALKQELASWLVFHPEPTALRQPSSRSDYDALAADGSRLANALQRLVADTESVDRPRGSLPDLLADLAAIVPGIHSVEFEENPAAHQRSINVVGRDNEVVAARIASDGTLRALALLTAAYSQHGFGLVGLEEIENGIHPERSFPELIRRLRDIVHDSVEPGDDAEPILRQVIASSHSPTVLGALSDRRQSDETYSDVVFLDTVARVDGRDTSRITRRRPVVQPNERPHDPGSVVLPAEILTFDAVERLARS